MRTGVNGVDDERDEMSGADIDPAVRGSEGVAAPWRPADDSDDSPDPGDVSPDAPGDDRSAGTPPAGEPAPTPTVESVVQAGWPGPPTAPLPSPAEPPPAAARRADVGVHRWRTWLTVAAVSGVIGGAVGAVIATAVDGGGSTPTPTSQPEPSVGASSPGPALAGGASIPAIAQKVLPEVVSIDAKGPGTSGSGASSAPSGSPFGGGTGTGTVENQGTGMILSGGQVLTNNHVIAGATSITVTVYNQTKALSATVIGADAHDDAALLQITDPPSDLHTITFGNSRELQVGDALVAIGNALGLSAGTPTVTSGIVSALGRTVQAGDTGSGTTETLTNMIQTDAAINPGNSGGPLVDSSGDVVGMNTAVASSSGNNASAQNIGFAIPESNLQTLIPQLRQGGVRSSNAYLGVEIQDLTPQLRQAYGFTPTTGALVDSVVGSSPAAAAGLQTGDVIVSYDGQAITSAQDLTSAVRASKPGQKVQLVVWRGSEKLSLSATLTAQPAR
jgi:putative serine protease PepD